MGFLATGMPEVDSVTYLLSAYLLGSLPTGYLMGRWLKGIDIRTVGSGNMGATNVFRTLGKGPGFAVLFVDMAKGLVAVKWLPVWFSIFHGSWQPLPGALAVVLGHNYTCFLNFKGGKGVATSAGALLGLAPYSSLASLALFVVVVAAARMISVGSLVAAAVLPVLVSLFNEGGQGTLAPYQPVEWLALCLGLFVWVKHIPNIKRLLAGTENRFEWDGKKHKAASEEP